MAKSVWWLCGKCGFVNKPHAFRKDNAKCEQCGSDQAEASNLDLDGAQLVLGGVK